MSQPILCECDWKPRQSEIGWTQPMSAFLDETSFILDMKTNTTFPKQAFASRGFRSLGTSYFTLHLHWIGSRKDTATRSCPYRHSQPKKVRWELRQVLGVSLEWRLSTLAQFTSHVSISGKLYRTAACISIGRGMNQIRTASPREVG